MNPSVSHLRTQILIHRNGSTFSQLDFIDRDSSPLMYENAIFKSADRDSVIGQDDQNVM